MNDLIMLKLGEIVLKGLNRKSFEAKLMANIRRRLEPIGSFKVNCMQSAVYVEPKTEAEDMDAAFESMKKVFGVITMTRAMAGEKDKDAIVAAAKHYLPEGCTVFHNSCGTAPGYGFTAEWKHVVMLPGPPKECMAMLRERERTWKKLPDGLAERVYR